MSEIRYCILKDTHTIVEPKRAFKPFGYKIVKDKHTTCPFCLENQHLIRIKILEIGDCRVVANQYNALAIENDNSSQRNGFFEYINGFGAHEVIIETSIHNKKMCDYSLKEFNDYFLSIQRRFIDLKQDSRIKYIQLFKNSGVLAGASLPHEHSQILALPYVPKYVESYIERNREYKKQHLRNIMDDMVSEELQLNTRVAAINSEYIAFCPYASQFPFEIIITPLSNIESFENISNINELSSIFKRVFAGLYETIGDFSFNIYLQNTTEGRFYFDITPRIYQIGGFELSTQLFINPVLPEEAALKLKESV